MLQRKFENSFAKTYIPASFVKKRENDNLLLAFLQAVGLIELVVSVPQIWRIHLK